MQHLQLGDYVYDNISKEYGAIGEVYNNYWEMLSTLDITEQELIQLGFSFEEDEQMLCEFYLVYVEEGDLITNDARVVFKHRPNLNKMMK